MGSPPLLIWGIPLLTLEHNRKQNKWSCLGENVTIFPPPPGLSCGHSMGTWSPRGGKAPTTGATTKVPLRSPEGRRRRTTARSLAVAAQNGTLRAFFVASQRVWPTETEALGLG